MSNLKVGHVFVDRYEVVGYLGAGGMGTVYAVVDQNTRRRRALKVMRPEVLANDMAQRRFRREATVAAAIESDHIAEVLDAGIDPASKAPYIVLELLKGQDLRQVIEQRKGLPSDEVVRYLRQIAIALDKAHAAGVVHRDLKPDNLFVTYRDDGKPLIKLLDFGIAKLLHGSVSGPATQGALGTPLYMAPEQMLDDMGISAATDLFALGLLTYTLLTGEAYWQPEYERIKVPYQLLVTMLKGPPQTAHERAAERTGVVLPASFEVWFLRATARDPAMRFAGAVEMVEDLAELLGES